MTLPGSEPEIRTAFDAGYQRMANRVSDLLPRNLAEPAWACTGNHCPDEARLRLRGRWLNAQQSNTFLRQSRDELFARIDEVERLQL